MLKTKLSIVTISGRKARGWDGDRACRYKTTSNVLILKLGNGFPGIYFNVYLKTYIYIAYILSCASNVIIRNHYKIFEIFLYRLNNGDNVQYFRRFLHGKRTIYFWLPKLDLHLIHF